VWEIAWAFVYRVRVHIAQEEVGVGTTSDMTIGGGVPKREVIT